MKRSIGVIITCTKETDLEAEFEKALAMGLDSCQISIWTPELYEDDTFAERIVSALEKKNFTVSALWAGWSGPREWNFTAGPATLGLVPATYRYQRLQELLRASDFAEKLGVKHIATHVGFLPENPDNAEYPAIVAALRHLCKYMDKKGQFFLFETGQETPVTVLRTIQAIGTENLGVNFDMANLILYGKANPLDALDVFGQYVMGVHVKDGFYPTDGMSLGREVPAGEGKANVTAVIQRLDELGYTGAFTIEREIKGDKQIADIEKARDLILSVGKA